MNTTMLVIGAFCLISVVAIVLILVTTGYLAGKGARAAVQGVSRTLTIPLAIQQKLGEARRYGKLIIEANQKCSIQQQERLAGTTKLVHELLANLDRLEQNLEKLHRNRNVSRELARTQSEIAELQKQLSGVEGKRAEALGNLLKTKENHLAVLSKLQEFQGQIEVKVSQIASVLNSTHAEVTLIVAKGDLDNNRFRRLNQNLQENSDRLTDLMVAMEEMELYSVLPA